jgi:hypothetical protein
MVGHRYKVLNKDIKKKQRLFRLQDTYDGSIVATAMTVDSIYNKWRKFEQNYLSEMTKGSLV